MYIHILKILGIVILDQLCKIYMQMFLTNKLFGYTVLPFLTLYLTKNTGISLSLFSLGQGSMRWVLVVITSIIVCFLLYWLYREKITTTRFGLCLIVGGAISNIIDRVVWGGVIDFIHIHYQKYTFPIFNTSDILISAGVVLILLGDVLAKKC